VSHDLKEKEEIHKKRCDLIGRVNMIVGTLAGVHVQHQLRVLQSQCHFYGAEAWHLTDTNVKTFHSAFNRGIRRLMHLPYATHTRFLPELSGLPHSKDSIANRLVKFYGTMLNNDNDHISYIARIGLNNAQSIIGSNLSCLARNYGVPVDISSIQKLSSNICDKGDLTAVQAIKDCLEECLPNFFTPEDKRHFLTELCEY
jgi:hypothetical protein